MGYFFISHRCRKYVDIKLIDLINRAGLGQTLGEDYRSSPCTLVFRKVSDRQDTTFSEYTTEHLLMTDDLFRLAGTKRLWRFNTS